MIPPRSHSALILLFVLAITTKCSAAPKAPGVNCATSSGQIFVRDKCNRGERTLTLSLLSKMLSPVVVQGVGPAGPQGPVGAPGPQGFLNLGSCHVVTQSSYSPQGEASAVAICPTDEFMLTYGAVTDPVTTSIIRFESLYFRGNVPVGVQVSSGTEIENFNQPLGVYTLFVNAVCCSES
jgi:hypothetical protein